MAEATLYESTYILTTDLEEEGIEQITARLRETVEQAGAEFVADHLLGRRQLAYQINHHSAGIYRVMYFKGDGEAVNELKNELLMNEYIIRGIVVQEAEAEPMAEEPVAETSEPEAEAAGEAEEPEATQEAEAEPMAEEPVAETSEPEAKAADEASPEQPEAEATETEPASDD